MLALILLGGVQQAQLLDSLFGTERGLSASSEVRAEINELITQLEAKNPNPSLSEVRLCSSEDFCYGLIHCITPLHVLDMVEGWCRGPSNARGRYYNK